jgi:nitroreductase
MDVLEAIKERRSIRKFEPKKVPNELIRSILDAARWAPSAKNSQPWEFIVIKNRDTKFKLAGLTLYGKFIAEAPVVIAVVTDPRKSPKFHIVDGSCAVQNMILAAWNYGLGTCWIGTMDREKAKQVLGVPNYLHLLTVIPVGYPAEIPFPSNRRRLDEIVHYERYEKKS